VLLGDIFRLFEQFLGALLRSLPELVSSD